MVTSEGLYEVIGRRRDVRAEFNGAPVDPQGLDRMLGAAHTAPSVGMSQPWDFVLIRDRRPVQSGVRPIARLCVGPVTELPHTPDLQRHGWRSPAPLASVVHYEHYDSTCA
jgi:hypothetical protein